MRCLEKNKLLGMTQNSWIIIGQGYKHLLDQGLRSFNISPIYLPANPYVDCRLRWHADLSVFYPGGDSVILAPHLINTDFSSKLNDTGFKCIFADIRQGEKYPNDTQLNACAVGTYLFYSSRVSYEGIRDLYTAESRISVKQAYCGCSICVVNDNSIITADRAIALAAEKNGIEVLLISPGNVQLDGFEYGFIGGAGFKTSDNCLLFTGRLDSHPDCSKIMRFLEEREIQAKFITKKPIFDIGCGIYLNKKL